jgi:trehalose 6-phosphate synthase
MLMGNILEQKESTAPNVHRLYLFGREVSIGSFPVSIDYQAFAQGAATPKVAELTKTMREDLPRRQLIVGIDRLDYTKGIPFKLRAFETALQKFPDLIQNVTLIQNVVPSREDIHEYHDLKNQVEQMVGEINGRYTQGGWIPIHYHFHSSDRNEVLAYYRMSGIAMVTPLKDGMNLVAKEYCAANVMEDGVLILSEFAGAAAELQKGALLVNPYDIEGMAEAIHRAFQMDLKEKKRRMKKLRNQIKKNNIFKWADSFLKAAIAEDLSAFPESQEYVPSMNIA